MLERVCPPGCERLVEGLDEAVRRGTVEEITAGVQRTLTELISQGGIDLPPNLTAPAPNSYARRLIYRSDDLGYTAVAMVWGPGQGTPVHDHAGMWCVEGVLQGEIEVTQYDRVDGGDDDRVRFRSEPPMVAGVGSSGRLIPPFEYHTIANAGEGAAITIHVYAGEMDHCVAYHPAGDGWFRPERRPLSYTA